MAVNLSFINKSWWLDFIALEYWKSLSKTTDINTDLLPLSSCNRLQLFESFPLLCKRWLWGYVPTQQEAGHWCPARRPGITMVHQFIPKVFRRVGSVPLTLSTPTLHIANKGAVMLEQFCIFNFVAKAGNNRFYGQTFNHTVHHSLVILT